MTQEKTDLTMHGEEELTINVINDEYLYQLSIKCNKERLLSDVKELFTYYHKQHLNLLEYLDEYSC